MTSTTLVDRVAPGKFASSGANEAIQSITAGAAAEDGQSPLNEATLLALRNRGLAETALWVASEEGRVTGFALASPVRPESPDTPPGPPLDSSGEVPVDVNLAVEPGSRGRGVGRALVTTVLGVLGDAEVTAWAHGNHPAASALARELGFARVRDLWVMRLSSMRDLPGATPPDGVRIRAFEQGRDEQAFLAVNAAAFAHHAEQGQMTLGDLEDRMAEPWFDPAGFFLAESARTGELLGFHWTKTHAPAGAPSYGEVYVVGIAPQAQGLGLGRLLTTVGLEHLRVRGLGEVVLYVEADNAAAIAVYAGLGFTHAERDTDVQYRRALL